MSKKDGKDEVKRTTISPGIFMDKFREKVNGINYYVIKVELKLFQVLEITIDFANSKNIKVEGSEGLESKAYVQPFEYSEVARLVLNQGWSLKTKINFTMTLPDIPIQRKFLKPFEDDTKAKIQNCSSFESMDFLNIPEEKLNNFLDTKQSDFVDREFIPDYPSVGFSEEDCIKKYDSLIHWKRIKDITYAEDLEKKNGFPLQNFETPAHPTDVKSGKLDDLLVLSAIAALSEIEGMAERSMELKSPTSKGFVKIKTFDLGLEKVTIMDDYIPCFPLGEPIFGSNFSHSFWVILLEKALARKYGSYAQLRNISYQNAIIDISGLPTFSTLLPGPKIVEEPSTANTFWNTIKEWLDNKYLVTADTKKGPVENTPKYFNNQTSCVIIKAAEKDDIKLINLRNQFGVMEWEGDWSLQSPLWTEEMIRHFLPDMSGEDDTIWLNLTDFLKHFNHISVTKTGKWKRKGIKGQFITLVDDENPTIKFVTSRNHYELNIQETNKLIIGLHQEDNDVPGVRLSRPYLDIGVSVLKKEAGAYKIVANFSPEVGRQIYLEHTFEPGKYIILPTSSGLGLKMPPNARMTMRNYSMDEKSLNLIVQNIFHKLDNDSDGYISYPEMRKFYAKAGKKLTEEDFKILLNVYAKKNLDIEIPKGFPEKQFSSLFFDLFDGFEQAQPIFQAFGFNQNLFSFRSRVYGLTIHSDAPVTLEAKDSLAANTDYINTKLNIKLLGSNITDMQGLKKKENEGIIPRFYLNE